MEGESERKEERGVRNRMRGGRETERPGHQVLRSILLNPWIVSV